MTDLPEPKTPRRPVRKPSVWSPRPIPQPAPERRTADPPTPMLRELAAREQERTSLRTAHPQVTALASQRQVPRAPCHTQGALADRDAASAFAGGMRELQSRWSELDENRKLARLEALINAPLRQSGMPPVTAVSATLVGRRTGVFDAPNWQLQFQKRTIDAKILSDEDGLNLTKTVWHEARHAEQYYLAARREAASERDAGTLFYRTGVSSNVTRAALVDPVLGTAPDVTALFPASYPDTHPAAMGACADAMHSALIADRGRRTATINELDAKDAARSVAPTGSARNIAERAYSNAVSAYTALPEERDAFDVEPLIAQAWSITQPQHLKRPLVSGP